MDYEILLPYPDVTQDNSSQKRVLTVETAQILAKLLDNNQIPGRVRHFISHLGEIKEWQINRKKP